MNNRLFWQTLASIFAIFVAAVLVRECRDIKNTHDAVLRLEAQQKK